MWFNIYNHPSYREFLGVLKAIDNSMTISPREFGMRKRWNKPRRK